MRIRFFLFIYFFISFLSQAQYYSSGADPANIKWKQVNSDVFKVVYPEEFDGEAKRFIAILDSLYQYGGYTLDHTPKPIKVLIHSRSAYSNGFVSWAPKRMEIYPTPHQDMLAQDWLEQLAIHEFRHVVQIDKLNKGFTKFLTIPFGQQAIGAVLGLYAPLWFLEGDATLSETTLSHSGRGRRPAFEQETRAQVLEKEIYSYEKAYFGSYKDYVPNHYHMGYLFTAGARYKYGPEVWEKALDEAGRKSWSITPFNRGVKNVTGKNKVPLYHEIFNDWKMKWTMLNDSISPPQNRIITKRDTRYKNYMYPNAISDDQIITEVSGPGELNHFATLDIKTGHEEKILITGSRNREPFSYNNNHLVWTELEQHPRWDNQYFSVIRTFNLQTRKQNKISHNTRYKAPSLSPDGQTIAVVETDYSNQFSIHLLNANDGTLIKAIKTPHNAYPMNPQWHDNGVQLVMILLTPEGKQIVEVSTSSEQWNNITDKSFTEIRFPRIHNNFVYFCGSYSGIENIYRIPISGGITEKVTESAFGATYPSISNNGILYYQDYTSDGYQIAYIPLSEIKPIPLKPTALPNEEMLQKMQADEKGMPQLKNLATNSYKTKNYSKWNLFNFHSWAPAFVNIDDANITAGASVLSQNLLGTTFTSIGFNADEQYSREKFNFKFAYQAWWPVFDLEVKVGNEQPINDYFKNSTDTFHILRSSKPNHLWTELKMKLPLNFSRGKYFRNVQPQIGVSYQQSDDYSYEQTYITVIDDGIIEKSKTTEIAEGLDIRSLDYSFFAYNLLRSTQRDIASRWGHVMELSYRHTPMGGNNYGSILGVHTRLYFPGIGRHHSIRIDNDWHTKEKGELYQKGHTYNHFYIFSDYVRFPRGVQSITNDELYSFKGDYILPLMNPDLNIPGILYLKRITANLFYDFSLASQNLQYADTGAWTSREYDFSSFGTELRGELHPFRFVFPISVGYRYAYIPNGKQHYHEMLLSMGLASIVVGNK
ncbi:hypothetical protein [Carboxylicivirga sp. M1479]|uniref:TolB family protein n=1 Tax=Carboxylicivirga sp. M1479 TaxID=2594476 RepID=UPI0011785126|nr:hypothetical protein [Carboxylicivirga sp. M1479]TRX66305.1 hypothetical protein FNN09_13940 [Carboxylicivirga sp. M1479]